jgi:CheY-like chemotaxis protein
VSSQPLSPPDDFVDLVRDALLHLYEPAHLQSHPLLEFSDQGDPATLAPGRRLRQMLLDAIEALHPDDGTPMGSRAWRTYRILELRYIEGQDSASAADQLPLSRAQYHRDHQRALLAVATRLWEQWQATDRWARAPSLPPAPAAPAELAQQEADLLQAMGGPRDIDPIDLCRSVGRLLAPLYQSRGSQLTLDLPDSLPPIAGDRVVLRQALVGVLAHALDTAGAGGVTVTASATARQVLLTMTGPCQEPLTGLEAGIAEIQPFIDSLQGDLRVQAPASADRSWRLTLAVPVSQQRTLLVVDNSPDFIRLVERFLDMLPWRVVGASDVEQAAEVARQHIPTAILLDIVLPARDGWELLEELQAHPATRAIPVIVCSILDEPAVALSLGAAAYLRKPVDQRRLIEALADLR